MQGTLKALEKQTHEKNSLLARVCIVEGTHRQWTERQHDPRALTGTGAWGVGGREDERKHVSVEGAHVTDAAAYPEVSPDQSSFPALILEIREATAVLTARPMSIQMTRCRHASSTHFNKITH